MFKLNRAMAIAAMLVLPLPTVACSAAIGGGDKSDIVIAADLELTGAYSDVGSTYERALQLEVDQINQAGGVLGGRKLVLDIKDNRSDPGASVSNVNAFSAENVAGLIMGYCSECVGAVYKALDDKGIPTVSLAPATGIASPVSDRKFIFKLGPNAEDSAVLLAGLFQQDKVTGVGLLSTQDTDGGDAITAMQTAIGKAQVKVVATEQFKPNATDEGTLAGPVSAVLTAKPDAVVISAPPEQAMLAAKAARDAGYTGKLYFDQTAAGNLFLTGAAAKATNDVTMAAIETMAIDDTIATDPANVTRKQWFNDYTAKYGNFSAYSTFAADAVQVIERAIAAAGSTDHNAVRDQIENSQFEGLAGQIRITPENHSGLMPQALTLLVVRGGRWRLA